MCAGSVFGFSRKEDAQEGANRAQNGVQAAFVAAFEQLAELRDPCAFGAWLFGIVRRMAVDALRAKVPVLVESE